MNYFRIPIFMCYIQFELSRNHDHHVTESEFINGDRVASAVSELWGFRRISLRPSFAWRPAQLPEPPRQYLQSSRRVGCRVAGYLTSPRSCMVPVHRWSCAPGARHLPRRTAPSHSSGHLALSAHVMGAGGSCLFPSFSPLPGAAAPPGSSIQENPRRSTAYASLLLRSATLSASAAPPVVVALSAYLGFPSTGSPPRPRLRIRGVAPRPPPPPTQ
jgi:hypothetical protein